MIQFLKTNKNKVYICIFIIVIIKLIDFSVSQIYFKSSSPPLNPINYNNYNYHHNYNNNNKFFLNNFISNNNNKNINKNKKILKYNNNNKFKIIQFTDLHYGENKESDILTLRSQENIIEIEQPDFVVLSGDIISAYKYYKETQYLDIWVNLTKPMIKRNIPWAITFGNHDCEGPLTCLDIAQLDMSFELSLTQININELPGLANYQLNIFSNNHQGIDSFDIENAQSLIYIFDSETEGCSNSEPYGCVHKSQVDWYKNISDLYNKKEAIAFVHIPPHEVVDVWNHNQVTGNFGDTEVCCYYTDKSNFVDTIIKQGDIKGLYFGHDHGNDYHGEYNGLNLGYGRKSGFGSYNPKTLVQGARVFEITAEPFTIDTWIRTSYGEKDIQKKHTPKFLETYNIICCIQGDPRSKPWFSRAIRLVSVGIGIIITCILAFIFYRKYGNKTSILYNRLGSVELSQLNE